jgi:hypothetical protein
MNTCLDIRKWLPVETIVTRTSSILIQNEELVSEEKNQPKEILKKAYPFPSFTFSPKGDLHSDFWAYLPGDSKEVRRVIRGSCAIVSGSSRLLQHEKGAEIDSHNTVIRFNNNPTKGYEKHVGR